MQPSGKTMILVIIKMEKLKEFMLFCLPWAQKEFGVMSDTECDEGHLETLQTRNLSGKLKYY